MRLIDADALANKLIEMGTGNGESELITQTLLWHLDRAPSVSKWIPTSERLPEEGELVLTQANFKNDVKMAVSSRIDYNYWTGWGTRDIDVIAWMPLPEPYKGVTT